MFPDVLRLPGMADSRERLQHCIEGEHYACHRLCLRVESVASESQFFNLAGSRVVSGSATPKIGYCRVVFNGRCDAVIVPDEAIAHLGQIQIC